MRDGRHPPCRPGGEINRHIHTWQHRTRHTRPCKHCHQNRLVDRMGARHLACAHALDFNVKSPHMSPRAARATHARAIHVSRVGSAALAGCRLSAPGRSTPRAARHSSTHTTLTLARPSECRTGAGGESHARRRARDNFVRSRTMCQTATCHRPWWAEGGPREVLAARIAPRNSSP
jgi:hypothetical protein